jgi:hypothetical protein
MKTPLIALAGALALSAAAMAQGLPAIDANGDGAVDRAEFDAYVASSFAAMDANDDGYITEAESAAYMPADLYASANSNGDDGISLQEYQAQGERDWTTADKDGDGILR